ncbi:hypothetical protein [Aquicella lusitana]|uniref:Uncharacterized protein n=1 Tax=Aquicella lusitana TaxID=254246 RepID=A0A370GDN1_9COXI|nr:hypothetical protein [Aquicella lusitana]RDI41326.1 hypothetical protein C8D86_12026 [Aquicella lusitana]VVC72308.1 hypothetical protein AQULUS_00180 [Aquicella lusitana]
MEPRRKKLSGFFKNKSEKPSKEAIAEAEKKVASLFSKLEKGKEQTFLAALFQDERMWQALTDVAQSYHAEENMEFLQDFYSYWKSHGKEITEEALYNKYLKEGAPKSEEVNIYAEDKKKIIEYADKHELTTQQGKAAITDLCTKTAITFLSDMMLKTDFKNRLREALLEAALEVKREGPKKGN